MKLLLENWRKYLNEVGMGFDMAASSSRYTGFILDDASHQKLAHMAPEGWKVYAHHMTMIPPTDHKQRLPSDQFYDGCLTVVGIAQTTTSQNLYSKTGGVPHITIATNGVLPAVAAEFGEQDFKPIDPIEVCGKVEEVMK